MAKITSSSFGLSSTGERLGGKSKIIKIPASEKSLLKILTNIDVTLKSILTTLTGAAKEDKKLLPLDKQRKEEETRPKITSSSFGLSSTGERLGGKKTTIKISAPERSSLKILNNIDVTLKSILTTLTGAAKEDKKLLDKQRKEEENKRRSEREKGLESKVFDGIKVAAKTVMKPFTSIWDWITNFFWNVFLGKVVIKLLNWFSDPKNKDKIKSIVRFFKDWWPTMLGAYILFGTSFGKLARGLVAFAGRSVIGLAKVIFRLGKAIAKGKLLKGAGALSGAGGRSAGRGRGRGIGGALLAIGGTLLTGYAIDKGTEALMGGGEEKEGTEALMGGGEEKEGGENLKIDVPDAPEIPMLNAATGGLADIGKLFGKFGGGAGLGAMFGPLGMLMSMGMGALPQMFQGLVSGKKGTDKVPAMLTDGEFVMSKGAVQKYGVDTLEAMNAAGGGTNIPKIVKGIPHASGGGLIGGVDELRSKYDAKHGAGAYDKESARRKAQYAAEDAAAEAKRNKKPVRTETALTRELKAQAGKGTKITKINGVTIPVGIDPSKIKGAQSSISSINPTEIEKAAKTSAKGILGSVGTAIGSGKLTAEQQRRLAEDASQRNKIIQQGQQRRSADAKARAEYNKIIGDMSNPEYDKAWNDPNYLSRLKQKYRSQLTPASATPTLESAPKSSGTGYTPYKSRFAGSRDAAFAKARGIGGSGMNSYNPFTLGSPGGVFGGPRMQARTDYAASKGKYYSLSDQKTYGNYNDARAAKKSRMTNLASQQRLNKLSFAGASRNKSKGVRIDAEEKARSSEFQSRGGLMGQLGRFGQRAFGGAEAQRKLDAEQKASTARVKQAGAASIGRYYSSSDGKYYKDYNAAKLARQQRLKSGVKPPVKPAPKVAGGGMGGRRGSGVRSGSRPAGNTPPVKPTANSTQTRQTARQRGIGAR